MSDELKPWYGHTPTPWESDNGDGYSIWSILADGKLVAHVIGDSAEADANAAYIVHCVNAHDRLVEQRDKLLAASKMALNTLEAIEFGSERLSPLTYQLLRKAIAACEGEGA